MPDVIRALVWHEEPERRRHQFADMVERARPRSAEERLQFGEGEFDRIEVGTVGREKSQERSSLFNRLAYRGLLVGREIVEHDDITGAQRRRQDLLHVGAKGVGVNRSIEYGRRGQLPGAERRDHGMRLPVTARGVIPNARAAQAAGVATQQIRGHARFVDEDVLSRITQRQRLTPLAPSGRDIRSTLFVGVYRFF